MKEIILFLLLCFAISGATCEKAQENNQPQTPATDEQELKKEDIPYYDEPSETDVEADTEPEY